MLEISSDGAVDRFCEKTPEGRGWVNGGYMVLEPKVFDYIEGDETVFEREPMEKLAAEGQLQAFRHDGFWQCMDTAMERKILEDLIITGEAPWMTWED